MTNPVLAEVLRKSTIPLDYKAFATGAYLEAVESVGVDVSMDRRGRWIDNRFIERLWRSVKQEDICLQDYCDGLTAQRGLARWFGD